MSLQTYMPVRETTTRDGYMGQFKRLLAILAVVTIREACYYKLHSNPYSRLLKQTEGIMEFIIGLLIIVVVLDIATLRWGFDSTDGINSLEWLRRQEWKAFQ
jgi:hypothetical protein